MEVTDDSREIIYIALCNQIAIYSDFLEEDNKSTPEERKLAQYLIMRSEQILDSLSNELEETPISRPSWKKI